MSYSKYICNDLHLDYYEDGLREFGNTQNCLNICLEKLFPNNVFIHDKFIKHNNKYIINEYKQKIRPDYICEELKMIIEFDGYKHYTDPYIICKDIANDKILKQYGYNVIHIPFYVQLDASTIKHYFNIKYDDKLYNMCGDHGFMHPNIVLPTYFCDAGKTRFLNDLTYLPADTFKQIAFSIGYRIAYCSTIYNNDVCGELVLSTSLFDAFKYLYANNNIVFDICSNNKIDVYLKTVFELPVINESVHDDINSMCILESPSKVMIYLS
jgi:very-short-patch-repair endonuclease